MHTIIKFPIVCNEGDSTVNYERINAEMCSLDVRSLSLLGALKYMKLMNWTSLMELIYNRIEYNM